MHVLMVAFEPGRWGAARLVKPLRAAGFAVASLCPASNPLAQTKFLNRRFALSDVRSSRRIEAALEAAMLEWQPRLVIPADERTVACLQALVRRSRRGEATGLSAESMAVIAASLGDPARFDATMLKSDTIRLARKHGVRVPAGATVVTHTEAISVAETIGYPVYVKQSFSWAGQGVKLCRHEADVAAALRAAQPRRRLPFRAVLKQLLHRDWYPTTSSVDVQQAIDGTPAFYCAVALDGHLLAGVAGHAQRTCAATGPSSVVRLGPNDAMAAAAATMIGALGATGFIGFDFMVEAKTGLAYMLECNPRPTPVCHLAERVGVNLCEALADAVRGAGPLSATADRQEVIALFPQEWLRDPEGFRHFQGYRDVPFDDPMLMDAMLDQARGAPPVPDRRRAPRLPAMGLAAA